jgi:outer membrane protein assembly factor BamA
MRILVLALLLSLTALAENSPVYIKSFEILNSIKTKEKFALSYISAEVGDQFNDSVKNQILDELNSTDLFSKINLTSYNETPDSVKILLVLQEKQRYYLSSIGGGLNSKMYGKETKLPWINFNAGVTHKNLFGRKQQVTLYGSIWRVRYVGGEWIFPIGRSGVYGGAGTFIGRYPSMSDQWLAKIASNSFLTAGKKWEFIDLRAQLNQNYRKIKLVDLGIHDNFWETIAKFEFNTSVVDRDFNPSKGFKSLLTLATNAIYPYVDSNSVEKSYLNSIVDLRFFTSPFGKRNIFALKLLANNLPAGSYNRYDRKYIGGTYTVRGFLDGSYGKDHIYENFVTATLEYRPHIWRLPSLKLPFMSWYNKELKDFPIDFDGVVFVEGGRLWKDFDSPFSDSEPHKTVASVGGGLRILVPTIEMSGSFDFAWPIYAPTDEYNAALPTVHVYANFPF